MTMPRLAARACSPGPQYHPVMGAVAPVPRICGREAEIAALGEALGRVAAGGPAIVLVEGEAGIGKTRLLAQAWRTRGAAACRWPRAGPRSWSGPGPSACWPPPSGAPGHRRTRGGRPSPGCWPPRPPVTWARSRVTSDPGLRFRVVDAFTDLVEELALAGPLVIGLDDLQWADPSSLLTLGVLGRRLDRSSGGRHRVLAALPARPPSWTGWPARWRRPAPGIWSCAP